MENQFDLPHKGKHTLTDTWVAIKGWKKLIKPHFNWSKQIQIWILRLNIFSIDFYDKDKNCIQMEKHLSSRQIMVLKQANKQFVGMNHRKSLTEALLCWRVQGPVALIIHATDHDMGSLSDRGAQEHPAGPVD